MQPGETRQVSAGTEVSYRLPSGFNTLTLPPLYVTAARILEVAPAEQMVGVGSTASGTFSPTHTYTASGDYTVVLTVTDERGGIGVATLVIDVKQQLYLPLIVRTP